MARWLCLALLLAAQSACSGRPALPIVTWHSISAAGDDFTVGEPALAAQLDALRSEGFHAVTFREWLAHEEAGAPLPARPILLTFDDGFEDAFTAALPALRARGMRATFFLVSTWIGADQAHRVSRREDGAARRYLVWPEVRALREAGMEIGSHGATHRRLAELREAEAREEVVSSRRALEAGLGAPVEVFAYPYNASRRSLRALVREAGYRAAASGSVHGGKDRFELYRFGVQRGTSPEQLLRQVTGGR